MPPFHEWIFPDGRLCAQFFKQGRSYIVRFPELADFGISADGLAVEGWPAPGTTDGTVQHLFLNQVMPLARSRSGSLMFHASAIAVDDFCIAFMGRSGRGKSTLAASFATSGSAFLTDDGLSVEISDGVCQVFPSHPSIRLWADSKAALNLEGAEAAAPVQFTPKSRLLASDAMQFCDEARRLRCVYVLGETEAPAPAMEPLAPSEALIELARNSFLLDIEEQEALATHFDELVGIVKLPIFFRLDYPRQFEALPATRAAILAHARQQPDGANR